MAGHAKICLSLFEAFNLKHSSFGQLGVQYLLRSSLLSGLFFKCFVYNTFFSKLVRGETTFRKFESIELISQNDFISSKSSKSTGWSNLLVQAKLKTCNMYGG